MPIIIGILWQSFSANAKCLNGRNFVVFGGTSRCEFAS